MAIMLKPVEREMPEAEGLLEDARTTLTALGAAPLLTRLEDATSDKANPAPSPAPPAPTVPVTA
jgi:hypothetical protein